MKKCFDVKINKNVKNINIAHYLVCFTTTIGLCNKEFLQLFLLSKVFVHYLVLHYLVLHYLVLHYLALHYLALHYLVLHYLVLH